MTNWQLVAHKEARDAMRGMGAVGPSHAVPYDRLPPEVQDYLSSLVESGQIREGAPGTFYLYERPRITKGRVLKIALFGLLVILIPVVILQLSIR